MISLDGRIFLILFLIKMLFRIFSEKLDTLCLFLAWWESEFRLLSEIINME